MKPDKSTKKKVRAAQVIIPPAAAALALTGCADTGSDNNTDNVIDGASFTTPVTVAGLPGQASGFSSYKVFQPSLADMDGDGDLDIFAGTMTSAMTELSGSVSSYDISQKVIFFKNTGSASSFQFEQNDETYNTLPNQEFSYQTNSYSHSSAVGPMFMGVSDVDDDGDMDLIVTINKAFHGDGGSYLRGGYEVHLADGTSFSISSISDPMSLSNNEFYAASFTDLDGDVVDMVIGKSEDSDYTSNLIYFSHNLGNGSFEGNTTIKARENTDTLKDLPVPSFADLDNDGDQDMFVVTYDSGVINYYENTGSAASPTFTSRTDNFNLAPSGGVKWFPAFGDMDGDGDLDAMIGTSDGKILYAENLDIE